jgi:hypothetical protein
MSQITSKVFEYIRSDSETNPDAESYEYYLVWLGVDGSVAHWLFEEFTPSLKITGGVVNTKSEDITKLIKNANKSVQLIAEDLSENEFNTITGINRALVVRRYYKDGAFDNLAVKSEGFEKAKSQFRYNYTIEVEGVEAKIMR